MIRRTLAHTQLATFAISQPNPLHHGMPVPKGTGFFVSPDGFFVTAAHVVTENNKSDGPPRSDVADWFLEKETRFAAAAAAGEFGALCQHVSLVHVEPRTDFALLKVDFEANQSKAWLAQQTGFPFLQVSTRDLEEGEPMYSFGYPLPRASAQQQGGITLGTVSLHPRVTSAIVSSTANTNSAVMTDADPRQYVLDRALNYGNSGGPIVAVETGMVHALCSSFQPMFVPQPHLTDAQGRPWQIMMPSLYGVVSSLSTPSIVAKLQEVGVPLQ